MEKKKLGIVGGMGPLATADLFEKIVRATQADGDGGHIRIFIDCNPAIPDRTAAILEGGADPVPKILQSVRTVEACGADFLAMPCNTAHYFLPRIQTVAKRPFISILEATAAACAARFPGQRAALLGTTGTYATGIYDRPLEMAGVPCIVPEERQRQALMSIIHAVKAGAGLAALGPVLEGVLAELRAAGADYFILGCTELPLAVAALGPDGAFVDPTQELAEAAIVRCGYSVKPRGMEKK